MNKRVGAQQRPPDAQYKAKRAEWLASQGRYNMAYKALGSEGVTPACVSTLEALQCIHPKAREEMPDLPRCANSLSVAGAPLTALNKKAGGIRPIAVGDVLRRLVSKCVCEQLAVEFREYLSPNQA
jgi:hypothetical protein